MPSCYVSERDNPILHPRVNFSSTVFSSSTETQPHPQIFSADFFCIIDVILPDISNILQIWSKQNSVKTIKNGGIFERELKT